MYETITVVLAGALTMVLVLCYKYLDGVSNLLVEIKEVLSAVQSAIQDGQITKDEIATIVKEAKDVVAAAKKIAKANK